MEKISNLTDRELLILIHSEAVETRKKIVVLEKQLDTLSDRNREMEVTMYGDDKRKVKGILHHIENMRATILKYGKWEFTAGFIIGAIGLLWGFIIGVKELLK